MKRNLNLLLAPAMAIIALLFDFVADDDQQAEVIALCSIMFAILSVTRAINDTRNR